MKKVGVNADKYKDEQKKEEDMTSVGPRKSYVQVL